MIAKIASPCKSRSKTKKKTLKQKSQVTEDGSKDRLALYLLYAYTGESQGQTHQPARGGQVSPRHTFSKVFSLCVLKVFSILPPRHTFSNVCSIGVLKVFSILPSRHTFSNVCSIGGLNVFSILPSRHTFSNVFSIGT